jgi:hypothetical protein
MTAYSNKEKPEPNPIRITDKIVDLAEKVQDLRFHIFKLETLKRQYESEGKKGDGKMVELFMEEHKKELAGLQKKLDWESLKLSSLIDPDKREKLVAWKRRIEIIKSNVPIDQVVSQYVSLRKSGSKFIGKCPFHDDKNPSFVAYPETSSYYCFGCRKSGDIFGFIMEIEKLSFKDAVEALSRYSGL